jgi:hypothetical protein
VAHRYIPSYSGGRAQEDHSSRPIQANSFETLSQNNPSQKRVGVVAQGLSPEFKHQYSKKKKKRKERKKRLWTKSNISS